MTSEPTALLRGIGNQFNTAAAGGLRPLGVKEIRSRLTADLFFADQICIPGTSLLCNPATFKLFNDDMAFLVGLLSENRLIPILPSDTCTFSALADKLADLDSSAIATSGQEISTVREVAALLDEHLTDNRIITVSSEDLDRAKTQTSQRLIRELRNVTSITEEHHRRIMELASRELDEKGMIPGTWWYYLAKRHLPELRPFDDALSEFGSIVFDFSYTSIAQSPLIGHSYKHDIEGVGKLAQPFAANYRLEISPGIFERRDLDTPFFEPDVLTHMSMEDFAHLTRSTQKERSRYHAALRQFRLEGSESSLFEAKERLDEYLISLAKEIDSYELTRFASEVRSFKRISSQIMVWQTANVMIYSFAVAGGWNEIVRQTLAQRDYGLFVLAGLGTAGALLADRATRAKQRLEAKQEGRQKTLRRIRPASIYVSVQESS